MKAFKAINGGKVMTMTSEVVNKEFKMWMTVTRGLIKYGKSGDSQARTGRVRTVIIRPKKEVRTGG